MANPMRRFDGYLVASDSASLKRVATLWGGKHVTRKDDCIAYLKTAFNDPRQIDAALTRMYRYERAALGLLKLFDGAMEVESLGVALRTTGTVPSEDRYIRSYGNDPLGRLLLERGIVMTEAGYRFSPYSYGESGARVFADERVIARIASLDTESLPVAAADYPATTTFRRVQSVVLDVISILRTVNDLGGIGLTKSGDLRVNDLRKLARNMGWSNEIQFDGLPFPEPVLAYVSVLTASGLLSQNGSAPLEQVVSRPAPEILRSLVSGILGLKAWVEYEPNPNHYWFRRYCPQGRVAVLTALRCLPDRRAWYRFEGFEQALFYRIGETYSVTRLKFQPHSYGKSAEAQRAELDAWRREIRENWEKNDVPWLQAVFQTWLYAFGLVELSLVGGKVDRFRLTDMGRAILWNDPSEAEVQPQTEQTPAWVVQPNFDVVVYLGHASTEQVAFLEQHAERLNVAQHTAQYRLTRDSVYEGLERGTGVDRFIEGLAAGSRVELPGNVVSEIRTWAALRERITLRRRAELLEFPDAAARQIAIDGGVPGLAVGERFLLLHPPHPEVSLTGVTPEVIDYANEPARCIHASEDGLITLAAEHRDLLTPGYLDLWAERESAAWSITRESVTEAMRRGRTLAELMALLQSRLTHKIPAILKVALRAWAGDPTAAGLAEAVILQCPQSDALDALLASQTLKPYLLGRIGPDAILVNRANVDNVQAILNWAGVQVSAKIKGH